VTPLRYEHHKRRHYMRFQTSDEGCFDELVVGCGPRPRRDGHMLHAEMLDSRSMFVDVAGVCLWVWIDSKGVARITMSEDRREVPVKCPDLRDPALDAKPKRKKRAA